MLSLPFAVNTAEGCPSSKGFRQIQHVDAIHATKFCLAKEGSEAKAPAQDLTPDYSFYYFWLCSQ